MDCRDSMFSPRSVLITGANRGLGLEFVKQLLNLPSPPELLFAACRDPDNAKVEYKMFDKWKLGVVKHTLIIIF